MSRTLKTTPASTGSSDVASTVSTAALISVCSASIIANTATAKPVPWRSVRPPSASFTAPGSAGGSARRQKKAGTTTSDTKGAAAMPIATADCPSAIPTITASAKQTRDVASRRTRPPYSAKRWWPARKPRAK